MMASELKEVGNNIKADLMLLSDVDYAPGFVAQHAQTK